MRKSALIILTDNFEEIEAVSPIDILRRAEVDVVTASRTGSRFVKGRSGIIMQADCLLEEVPPRAWDLLVIPGGAGTADMRRDERVLDLVRNQVAAERFVGAICAAPVVLKDAGVLKGRRVTSHQSVFEELPGALEKEAVVSDGPIVTSRGAGTSVAFALALVERLCGYNKALQIAHAICTEV
ncbi:MAG: DJ-1/PfpI family protein [Opitutales bacterium]|nr:DJ-1/PfpI family protein [Opitutales bacterium]